jgi:F0F1-type ATP synthase alpha subunit
MASEVIKFETGSAGIASNLEEILVGVILLGKNNGISEGSSCRNTKKMANINVAYFFLERVIDPLGNPVDSFGTLRVNCRTVLVDQLTKVSLDDVSREVVLRYIITQLIEAPSPKTGSLFKFD